MAQARTAKNISEKILLPISSLENERGGTIDLRVMAWVVDGKEGRPTLDKREMYLDDMGNKRSGKAKGLTAKDLIEVLGKLNQIAQAMGIPASDIEYSLASKITPATVGKPVPF